MAKYEWTVSRAVVEEEIIFQDENSFNRYLRELDMTYEPYKVVSKEKTAGGFCAVIRKRYGEYEFLCELDSSSLSPKEEEIRDKLNGIEWRDGVKYVSTPPEDKWPLLRELMMCRLQKDEQERQ